MLVGHQMELSRMAEVLKVKGYHYRYVFAHAAGHVDGKVVNQTLPEALLYVWQGYPIAAAGETAKTLFQSLDPKLRQSIRLYRRFAVHGRRQ